MRCPAGKFGKFGTVYYHSMSLSTERPTRLVAGSDAHGCYGGWRRLLWEDGDDLCGRSCAVVVLPWLVTLAWEEPLLITDH